MCYVHVAGGVVDCNSVWERGNIGDDIACVCAERSGGDDAAGGVAGGGERSVEDVEPF